MKNIHQKDTKDIDQMASPLEKAIKIIVQVAEPDKIIGNIPFVGMKGHFISIRRV